MKKAAKQKGKTPTNSGRKYRTYPTQEQQDLLLSWTHTIRFVRNQVIAWEQENQRAFEKRSPFIHREWSKNKDSEQRKKENKEFAMPDAA